jgi:hypothetical protein
MITQPELAQKIRSGYAKHNLTATNHAFYENGQACPIFAAFADNFETVAEAYNANTGVGGGYIKCMATGINVEYALAKAVSDLFDKGNFANLDEVLAKLDANSFEYSAE